MDFMLSKSNMPGIFFINLADATAQHIANIIVHTSLTEWKNIARALGVSESHIEAITYDHCRDLKEQCCQGIWTWWKDCGNNEEDNIKHLVATLKRLELQNAAGKCLMSYKICPALTYKISSYLPF